MLTMIWISFRPAILVFRRMAKSRFSPVSLNHPAVSSTDQVFIIPSGEEVKINPFCSRRIWQNAKSLKV